MTLGEYLRDRFQEAISRGLSDAQGPLDAAAQQARADVGPALQSTFGGGFGIGDLLGIVGLAGGGFGALGDGFVTLAGKAGEWVLGIASGWAMGSFFTEAARPLWLEITHGINDLLQSEIFDPNTAATLEAKGIIDNAFGRSEAAGGNLAGDHYDKLARAAEDRPGLAQLLALLNLNAINQSDVEGALQHEGIPPFWHGPLLELARNFLSPSDLALALLRGIIDDTTAKGYAKQLGMTGDDLDVLVGNTGEPPGLMELLEAYRRGFIDQATLERGIRQSRVRNEWIGTVEKLRYSPMSTSDAVRAVVQHHLGDAEAAKIADENGLRAEDFPILVESWGRPLSRTEMASLVHRGLASRAEFDQAMRESDVKDKYINHAFESTTRLVNERQIVSAIRYGALDLATGSKMLLQLGFSQESVAVLLKLGLREAAGPAHELTRSQITTLYADSVLTRAQAIQHLTALGYTAQDADLMLRVVDFTAKAKQLRGEEAAIKVGYLAGNIDKVAAHTQLVKAGLTAAQATALIAQWDRSKKHAERVLSPAQVLKAEKNQVLTPAESEKLLLAAGYSEHDATILIATYGA